MTWKQQSIVGAVSAGREQFARQRGISSAATVPLIAFRQAAWQVLENHVHSSSVEVGGILVGEMFEDSESHHPLVDVHYVIPAVGALESKTYFKFSPESWDYISRVRERDCPDLVTVGWYHSHPGLGVFYSATDRASQRSFFARPWNVGLVVDPTTDEVGLFLGEESTRIPSCHLEIYTQEVQSQGAEDSLITKRARLERFEQEHTSGRDGRSRCVRLKLGGACAGALLVSGVFWLLRRRRT